VRARAERQRPLPRPLRRDVELGTASDLPVRLLGADGDNGALREDHAPVLDLAGADPGGERSDRLEPEHLVNGLADQPGPLPEQLPLVRMGREQPDTVCELRHRRVDPAGQHVEHKVDALGW
jgi:hypothetical protein